MKTVSALLAGAVVGGIAVIAWAMRSVLADAISVERSIHDDPWELFEEAIQDSDSDLCPSCPFKDDA